MDVGYRTDKGVRRANNEDACLVMQKSNVFVVADGVGETTYLFPRFWECSHSHRSGL